MKIVYLATDHAGFEHKEYLKQHLENNQDVRVVDLGAFQYEKTDDYPDYISRAAKKVGKNPYARAIIFGGSGQGEAMMANKYPNVRATVYYGAPADIIELSREHNNANVLSIGARFVDPEEMKRAVDRWLSLSFSGDERHMRRIEKMHALESKLHSFITKIVYRMRK